MVFAVVSSDTSSPFHVYVSLFGCDDCAMPGTGPLIVKTIVTIAICIQCVAIGPPSVCASYALSFRSLSILMVPGRLRSATTWLLPDVAFRRLPLRRRGAGCGGDPTATLGDQRGFDLPAMKHTHHTAL